jgi:hypothetical protein
MSMLKCPRCGAMVEVSAGVTPRCGTCNFPEPDTRPAPRPGGSARLDRPAAARPRRPLGVSIFAALGLLGGTLVGGLGALLMLAGGSLFAGFRPESPVGAYLAGVGPLFGPVIATMGLLQVLIALGLWRGRGWAWTLEMIHLTLYAVLGVRGLLIGSNPRVGGVLVTCLLAWYFFTPGVKAYFGRAQAATA